MCSRRCHSSSKQVVLQLRVIPVEKALVVEVVAHLLITLLLDAAVNHGHH